MLELDGLFKNASSTRAVQLLQGSAEEARGGGNNEKKKTKQNKSKNRKDVQVVQERSQTQKVRRNERKNVGVKGAEGGDEKAG